MNHLDDSQPVVSAGSQCWNSLCDGSLGPRLWAFFLPPCISGTDSVNAVLSREGPRLVGIKAGRNPSGGNDTTQVEQNNQFILTIDIVCFMEYILHFTNTSFKCNCSHFRMYTYYCAQRCIILSFPV